MDSKNLKLYLTIVICVAGGFVYLNRVVNAQKSKLSVNPLLNKDEECFCQLQGQIDDCKCTIDTVDYFNNKKILPRLKSLVQRNYFKYFQYNTRKKCPFWDTSLDKCTSLSCGVKSCRMDELPPGLQKPENKCSPNLVASDLSDDLVDATLSEAVKADLQTWKHHDESKNDFCDIHSETCDGCDYIDLTINPERFTGYSGEASRRVWRAIYEENCFKPSKSGGSLFLQDSLEDMCLEKRAFYRAVSGLHSSITIHLTSLFAMSQMEDESKNAAAPFPGFQKSFQNYATASFEAYGPNLKEFLRRFDPHMTNGQGPYWLKNLYFVYLLELRALTKAATYLEENAFYTGDDNEDKETLIAVKELFNLFRSFPDHFDESTMFNGGLQASQLKIEFRDHFRNITSIMDCVSCEKCKLWGKLQTTGLGTALKILFSDEKSTLTLTRNEIVALFNAFTRISTSISQLEKFRAMIKAENVHSEL